MTASWEAIAMLLAGVLLVWGWRRMLHAAHAARVADWGRGWLNVLDGLNRLFCHRYHRLRLHRLRLPKAGAALVVANHVSGLDPLLMLAISPRPLRFIIAREQYDRWWLRWLFRAVGCIPVERSASAHAALSAARRALAAGEVVALFPFGGIHLEHAAPTRLRRGIVHLAKTSGAPVYALRLTGIRGVGRTLSAVFERSRAKVTRFPALYYDERKPDTLPVELTARLTGRSSNELPTK